MSSIALPITAPQSTTLNRFIVAGISITSLRRLWKAALPKKRHESSYVVLITSRAGSVTFAIAGAAIDIPAVTSGPFVAEVPFVQFKWLLIEPFKDGAMVEFELAPGSFCAAGIAIKSPQVIVQRSAHEAAHLPPLHLTIPKMIEKASDRITPSPNPETPVVLTNPMDAPMSLPLLGAYKYIRTYGIQRGIVSQAFVAQQEGVNSLLNRAASLLEPVAITRSDLERLLDKKCGIN